jgi:hypothetical protein
MELAMPTELVQLFPYLRTLKRLEKLYLIQFLVSELIQQETELIQSRVSDPIVLPDEAFDVASEMPNVLSQAYDLEIINKNAEALNEEAMGVLSYQIPL